MPNYAVACSCDMWPFFEESVTGAEKVFIGVLESKTGGMKHFESEPTNLEGVRAVHITTAVFKVTHPIKGKVEEIEIITTGGSCYGVSLPVLGVEYPIFADKGNILNPCGSSGSSSTTDDREKYVKKLKDLIKESKKLTVDLIKKNILESDKVFVGKVLSKKNKKKKSNDMTERFMSNEYFELEVEVTHTVKGSIKKKETLTTHSNRSHYSPCGIPLIVGQEYPFFLNEENIANACGGKLRQIFQRKAYIEELKRLAVIKR